MAVVKKWICDGCHDVTESPIEAETCVFFQIKVTAGSWGKDVLLCTKCHDRLLDNINPEKWPRCAPEGPVAR